MKRIVVWGLSAALALSPLALTACGGSDQQADQQPTKQEQPAAETDAQQQEAEPSADVQQEGEQAEQAKKLYTIDNVPLRKKADADAEKILTIPVAKKVTALKQGKSWTRVKYDGKKGYASTKFLTKSKKKAQAAKKEIAAAEKKAAEEQARALQEAQEQEAAEKAAAKKAAKAAKKSSKKTAEKTKKSSEKKSSKKTEKKSAEKKVVSKTKVPDCDNPEHGHYEIVYSDGSVDVQDY